MAIRIPSAPVRSVTRSTLLAACLPGLLAAATAAATPTSPPTGARATAKPGVVAADARPAGFLEMFVAGVVPSPDGHTLVLVNPDEEVLLPLGIGLTEALSIHGRLERHQFSRPMTHDLLDHIVSELGGHIVRVQIDDVRDEVFVGTVFIQTAGKVVSFDARPSDAVALALGAHAPIYVARPVVDRAAIHPGDIDPEAASPPAPAPARGVLSL